MTSHVLIQFHNFLIKPEKHKISGNAYRTIPTGKWFNLFIGVKQPLVTETGKVFLNLVSAN